MTESIPQYWTSMLIGIVILLAAIPYVARIRHPKQKALAAYFIFVSVFVASATLLFNLFAWLAYRLELGAELSRPAPALLFLALIVVPAIVLATWLARKPPWFPGGSRRPPD